MIAIATGPVRVGAGEKVSPLVTGKAVFVRAERSSVSLFQSKKEIKTYITSRKYQIQNYYMFKRMKKGVSTRFKWHLPAPAAAFET